jgi:hypothetical protein
MKTVETLTLASDKWDEETSAHVETDYFISLSFCLSNSSKPSSGSWMACHGHLVGEIAFFIILSYSTGTFSMLIDPSKRTDIYIGFEDSKPYKFP